MEVNQEIDNDLLDEIDVLLKILESHVNEYELDSTKTPQKTKIVRNKT